MKLISQHIRLLLFRNDCVVVPGLGGFILNRLPASLDEKEGKLYPPRALPFFNKQLQSNDGLLAASLVRRQKMEYAEAIQEIRRFADLVNESLEAGREYVLDGLGGFRPNEKGQISFYPDPECNLDPEQYGLHGIAVKELIKPSQVSRKALAPVRKRKRSWITLTACTLVILFGVWMVNKSVNTPVGKQWSALNPFGEFWNSQDHAPAPAAEKENTVPETETAPGNTETTPIADSQEAPENIAVPEEEDPAATAGISTDNTSESPAVSEQQSDSVYYIVVGAFRHSSYAARYERKLKKEGYSACTYQGDEWIRVCAEKHIYRFEAEERLDFIRHSANNKAWILAVPTNSD